MKVLHFVPSMKAVAGSTFLNYKTDLIKAMAAKAEVHVLTADACADGFGGAPVSVHTYFPAKILLGGGKRHFGKLLSALRPDVVHIHACWNIPSYCLFKECQRRKIPTVLTLDRRLEPWHYGHHYLPGKLLMLVAFQRYMLANAGALHLVCRQEMRNMSVFGLHPRLKSSHSLNNRMVVVDAFNMVHGMTAAGMADGLLRLYRKVLDTSPFLQMTEADREAEDMLLMAGVAGSSVDAGWFKPLRQPLETEAWRRIFLHSYDQGVADHVLKGAIVRGIAVQHIDAGKVDRFAMNGTGNTEKLRVPRLSGATRRRQRVLTKLKADGELQATERDICVLMAETALKIRLSSVRRADFVRLYQALRFSAYDEDLVDAKMRRLRLSADAASIFQILKERYGLGEGFMFADPADDKNTMKLRKKLFKSGIQ